MTVIAIIQARMGSTRLPGKILKEINGKPLLAYQIERLKASKKIDKLVIATTVETEDDIIVDFCKALNISYYRGSESDVLTRYYEAAQQFGGETIVRLTSDCPIIDPYVVDKTIDTYLKNYPNFDYVSNTIERTYPRGLDVEVFSKRALEKANKEAIMNRDREHVTAYFYMNPTQFKIESIKGTIDYSEYRWTVDTIEDFQLIKLIIENLYPFHELFTLDNVIELMGKYPEWKKINEHIEQKKI